MITYDERTYLPCHINIPKIDYIDKINFKYNFQSLDSMGDKICVWGGGFFYFGGDGKIELYCIKNKISCGLKK